jgi:hypothetical protein
MPSYHQQLRIPRFLMVTTGQYRLATTGRLLTIAIGTVSIQRSAIPWITPAPFSRSLLLIQKLINHFRVRRTSFTIMKTRLSSTLVSLIHSKGGSIDHIINSLVFRLSRLVRRMSGRLTIDRQVPRRRSRHCDDRDCRQGAEDIQGRISVRLESLHPLWR